MKSPAFVPSLGHKSSRPLLLAASLILIASAVRGETWTPTAAATYDWDAAGNWGGGSFPNSVGGTANISADFAGAQIINLNTPITIGSLTINDTGASPDSPVEIATGTSGSLTFQVASGNATLTNSTQAVVNVISAPVVFTSDTTVALGTAAASGTTQGLTLSGGFSGAGNITVTGSSTGTGKNYLTLSGSNTSYTGNWTLSSTSGGSALAGGGISIDADTNLGAAPGSPTTNITVTSSSAAIQFTADFTLNANRNILVNSGGSIVLNKTGTGTATVAGVISGAGGVSTNGGGNTRTIKLSGANTYTGATNVTTGKLQAGSTSAFGVNSAVTIGSLSSAVLDLNSLNNTIGSLAGSGGSVTLGSAILTTGGNNTSTTYSGAISGSGGFTKIGSGTQTLSGNNTYSGATTVNAGTLALGASDRVADTSGLVLGGGTFATGGFNETLNTLTLNASSTLDFGSGLGSSLVFSASNGIAWNGTLTLLNFDIGTDSLKFGTSVTALTIAQLNAISLTGFTAALDSNGFVTFSAIPEPSTCALLTGVFTLGLATLRRRRA
ncbi:beta strand repeat-containing protein [Rariglobus hedericola]|uniref:PEP-CTERM sorting domain-containing protein n=1 Tax=Rariglobus hedericola TaxID=2597822 RepID=A0A556QKZ1_9BACT|nr:autotransporter-associated beta strand repeat-containing protein [Rariglobus hedericola]TSJ77320.1 PEP-CTERM sorting domain-containing protein [Rariglobus hedericola]